MRLDPSRHCAWRHRSAESWQNGSTGIATTVIAENQPAYIGRFAPSPTGRLHVGSLVAAIGSWLDARANDGLWLLRIEDLDPPREEPGAADSFPRDLETLGLEWDGAVARQSERLALYDDALQHLVNKGLVYRCACSRRDIEKVWQRRGSADRIYPGTCLKTPPGIDAEVAYRLNIAACKTASLVSFDDRVLGSQSEDVAHRTGDFILKRRDGLHAYQLAVVVDDEAQSVTDIVRGADLLDNTARQQVLRRALGYGTPRYAHLPVVRNNAGDKLSKQTGAQAVDLGHPGSALCSALAILGYAVPNSMHCEKPAEILRWALPHWPERLSALSRHA